MYGRSWSSFSLRLHQLPIFAFIPWAWSTPAGSGVTYVWWWPWPSLDLRNGLVRCILESVGSVGWIMSFFSTWQMNGCVNGEKEKKHTVSTLTPSNSAPGKVRVWISSWGYGSAPIAIMFLNNPQTSSGIYGPTRLKVHLKSGSTLMKYRQVLWRGGSKTGNDVCVYVYACTCDACVHVLVWEHASVSMPMVKCKRSDLRVIWPANVNLILTSCTFSDPSAPSPPFFSSWGRKLLKLQIIKAQRFFHWWW